VVIDGATARVCWMQEESVSTFFDEEREIKWQMKQK
jgi:hypothetical protein